MFDMSRFNLEGKVALVTGACRGIGRAAALGLASAGADVAINCRNQDHVDKVADEIRQIGRKALPVAAHAGKLEEIDRLVQAVMSEFGRIDILVNNAGACPAMASVLDATERLWDTVINLNLKGYYFLGQATARIMKEQGGGKIINVASVDAHTPEPQVGIYSISKAGVVMLTKTMAQDLAPYNIRVNTISPGPVDTYLVDSHWFHLPEEEAKQQKAKFAEGVPLKRIADPDEIAGAFVYMASDASSFTTGSELCIDGGIMILPLPMLAP